MATGWLTGSNNQPVTYTRAGQADVANSMGVVNDAQLLQYPEAIDSWPILANTSTMTVTPNVAIAPDGTTTAEKIRQNQNIDGTPGSYSLAIQQLTGLTNGATYTFSVWVKNLDLTVAPNVYINDLSGVGFPITTCALSTSWTRCSVTWTLRSTSANPSIGHYGTAGTISGQSFYAWGANYIAIIPASGSGSAACDINRRLP